MGWCLMALGAARSDCTGTKADGAHELGREKNAFTQNFASTRDWSNIPPGSVDSIIKRISWLNAEIVVR